jgi:hypothetical protein
MKKIGLLFLSLLFVGLISSSSLFGASIGDFQSSGTGNWGSLATWQTWDGTSWVPATITPDNTTSAAVTVVSPNIVTVAASVSVRNVTVNAGAKVIVSGGAVLLTVTDEGMTVNGTLDINGLVPTATPYTVTMTTPAVLTIGATGVVNYNQTHTTASTKGALPIATWSTGSTLNVNSTGGTSATGWNAGTAQNFYNLNWDCPLMTGSFGWGFVANTIGGTVTILRTNTGRVQFFGGSSGTLDIMGDLVISGASNATINGTSSGTNDIINVHGNVNVNTTGNFSISRGSQGATGTSFFNFYGDVSIIAGSMQNSNTTPDGAKFVFMKSGTQNLTLIPTAVSGNAIPIQIEAGATVNLLSKVNFTTLYLNGGIITSSASNPLVMGWWTGTTVTSGTVSPTAPGSSTSYVDGPMAFLYATAGGATSKTLPIGKGGIYRPFTLALTQSAATLSTYTIEMFNAAPLANAFPGTLNSVEPYTASKVRYYTITETGGGSAFTLGSVKLSYDIDDAVSDAGNLRIVQGTIAGGGTWVDLGGLGTGSPTGTIISTNAFNDLNNTVFTLANNLGGTNPLPVELSSFSTNNNGRNIQLNWSTKTEKNSDRFDIQRSSVGNLNWAVVGSVKAAVLSNSTKNYSYSDTKLQSGKYHYRLKMIDNDGKFSYSSVEAAEVAIPKDFAVSQNYPNPFNPSTKIDYQVPVDAKVVMEVYNIAGQRVSELVNQEQSAGYYTVDFGASKLSSGVYIYRLSASDKVTGNNFSSIKKMMLLK